jgi:hypothetical protein
MIAYESVPCSGKIAAVDDDLLGCLMAHTIAVK